MTIDEDVDSDSFLDDYNVRGNEKAFLFLPLQRHSPTAECLFAPYEGA